jgi:hypothetical protein
VIWQQICRVSHRSRPAQALGLRGRPAIRVVGPASVVVWLDSATVDLRREGATMPKHAFFESQVRTGACSG